MCPICSSAGLALSIETRQVPVHCNLLWPTRDEAILAPKAEMRLAVCGECGHLFNRAFNPNLMTYTQDYENSLHFSPHFQRYAASLATKLIQRYDLHGKDIIEIGCGSGDFLTLLCKLGNNRGIGFDPGPLHEPLDKKQSGRITFIRDVYSDRYAHFTADLICFRHVLEHFHDPMDFLGMLRRAVASRPNAVLFAEVPNVQSTLRDLAIWDITYEHYSYFSRHSLARAFTLCGFVVRDITETFEGQFLCIEALPNDGSSTPAPAHRTDLNQLADDLAAFPDRYQRKLELWRSILEQINRAGRRAIVWGAGSKGVIFLNLLAIQDQIEYVVDINPRKQGKYIAGTGQKIVPPEFLQGYGADLAIVVNPIYSQEIRESIRHLGLAAECVNA